MSHVAHSCVWHGSYICVTRLVHTSCVTYMKRPIHIGVYTHVCIDTPIWKGLVIYGTWPTHVSDMAHTHIWQDWFICVTWWIMHVVWIIRVCDMAFSYMSHGTFVCVTCHMARSCVWHVTWHVRVCDTAHALMHSFDVLRLYVWLSSFVYVACIIHVCDTG